MTIGISTIVGSDQIEPSDSASKPESVKKERTPTPCEFVNDCGMETINPGYYHDICLGHQDNARENQGVAGCDDGMLAVGLRDYRKLTN